MNLSKIYQDISAQSILASQVLEDFVQESAVFVQSLKNDMERLNSFEAAEVLSFLMSVKSYFTSDKEWEDLAIRCLVLVRNGIYKREFRGYTAYSGLCYVCFLIKELAQRIPSLTQFKDSLEHLLANTLRLYLNSTYGEQFAAENTFELIYGLSGVLRYCYDEGTGSLCHALGDEVVNALIRRLKPKIIQNKPVPGFHYMPSKIEKQYMDTPAPNGCINYGMAHGIAGTIDALSFAYRKNHNLEAKKTIELLIAEFLSARYYVDGIVYWPGRISFEQYFGLEEFPHVTNRMSWCYGSPGVLRALYLAAEAISMTEVKRLAIDEMEKIAVMDTSQYGLNSPIICHGLAGMVLIMRRMYIDTQKEIFASKAFEITESLIYNFAYRETENRHLIEPQKIRSYDYLGGYTGILQTIYSTITCVAIVNEKRLLLR